MKKQDITQKFLNHWQITEPVCGQIYRGPGDVVVDGDLEKQIERTMLNLLNRPNLQLIIGPPGVGKTWFCNYLYQTLPIDQFDALILNHRTKSLLEHRSLGEVIATMMVAPSDRHTNVEIQHIMNQIADEKRSLVLIFDEPISHAAGAGSEQWGERASKLSYQMMEFIDQYPMLVSMIYASEDIEKVPTDLLKHHMPQISYMETKSEAKITTILQEKFSRRGLDKRIFDDSAYREIALQSHGCLRDAVALAEKSMVEAYLVEAKRIDAELVKLALPHGTSLSKESTDKRRGHELENPTTKQKIQRSGPMTAHFSTSPNPDSHRDFRISSLFKQIDEDKKSS